jgi:3-phytase
VVGDDITTVTRCRNRRRLTRVCRIVVAVTALSCGCNLPAASKDEDGRAQPQPLTASGRSETVPNDPDDPAIWVHPTDPSRSLVLGTDKVEISGGLYVFDLAGTLRQSITPLDRPNNVDVEYGVRLGARTIDIAVLTERKQHRLRVFGIARDGAALTDLVPAGLPVLEGQTGEASEPMGIALYKRPRDGAVFAIVAPKTGAATEYLWQYLLTTDDRGAVQATLVRRFGHFSRAGSAPDEIGEIEAVVVDDALGFVYYSDERYGVRKYHADPDHQAGASELAAFGRDGYLGDREGLAIYPTGETTGYVVSSDQIAGGTRLRLFRREGTTRDPHDHHEVQTILTGADSTDGLEVTARSLPGYPAGLLVMMNSSARNFLFYDWRAVISAMSTSQVTRQGGR